MSRTEPDDRIRYDQPWLVSFLRPTLIVVLVACLNVALNAFLHRLLPAAPTIFFQVLLLLGLIAAIIGVTTTTWLAQPSQRLRRTAAYRTAEIVCLLVLARLLIWLTLRQTPTFAEFILHPFSALVDGYFLVTVLVLALSWAMAAMFSDDLLSLAVQPDEIYRAEATTRDLRDTSRGGGSGRQFFLNNFVGQWIFGGVIMIMLAAGSQLDYANIGAANRGFFALLHQNIEPTVISAVIVYFFAGLVLISQGQLALLRARWTIERIPNSDAILRNWPGYALAMLIAVGALATIMPFGGTYYLSRIIGAIISAIYAVLFIVINLFMVLLLLLLSLLPFSDASEEPMQEMIAQSVAPPPPPRAEQFAWLGGTLFWVITALLIGYAAYIYFSGKGVRFNQLAWLWAMLKMRWQQLFGAYHDWRLTKRVANVRSGNAKAGSGGWRSLFDRFSGRKLNPEQRIRYFYLTMVEQAARAGAARQRAETPTQYGPRLTATLVDEAEVAQAKDAESGEDSTRRAADNGINSAVTRLTDDFVRVRYGGETVSNGELNRLEMLWKQVQTALKRYDSARN